MRRRGPGLLMTAAVVGGTTAVVTSSSQKKAAQQQQAAAQQQATQQQMTDLQAQQAQLTAQQEALAQQQATAQMAPAGPAAGSLDDQLVQIQKLSVMKDQGLLTDDEPIEKSVGSFFVVLIPRFGFSSMRAIVRAMPRQGSR